MKRLNNVIALAFGLFILAWASASFAQSSLKEARVQYNKAYQLNRSYTIIYDNTEKAAKLKNFRVEFFGANQTKLGATRVETFPINGKIEEYELSAPITGFTEVQLAIISLHAGDIGDFTADVNSILALNELTEVPEIPENDVLKIEETQTSEVSNAPPIAVDREDRIEATAETISLNISDAYFDPEGGNLRAAEQAELSGDFLYRLEADGAFTIMSPLTLGRYTVPYEVTDIGGEAASAQLIFDVILPAALEEKLNASVSSIDQLLIDIENKTQAHETAPAPAPNLETRLQTVRLAHASLSGDIEAQSEIDSLTQILDAQTSPASRAAYEAQLSDLKSQAESLRDDLMKLQAISQAPGTNRKSFEESLLREISRPPNLSDKVAALNAPLAFTALDLDRWEGEHSSLKARVSNSSWLSWILIIAALIGTLLLFGILLKARPRFKSRAASPKGTETLKRKAKLKQTESLTEADTERHDRVRPDHSNNEGVVFLGSPLLAGNVATPLAAAGQLTASQLQMLSGPYSVLRRGYEATGRIGYAQQGVPGPDDFSFGTGFLITDRHVVTNRHVHGLYGHYLLNEEDPGGIEFIAEKGKDATDFVAFNGDPPILIPQLDIAIFTLSRPVKNRKPLDLKPEDHLDLDGRNIVVIGYPDTHTPDNPEILSVVEADPVFAVKRLSQGQIFKHTTDIDGEYGVMTRVAEDKDVSFDMPAICHNASTLGGNSGSPLLDIRSGKLLGIHFAGYKVFNKKEAANLAMTIEQLSESGRVEKLAA